MRQAGIIAAGALYALQHHVDRLADDHQNAQILAQGVRESEGLSLQPDQVDTNIVIFQVDPAHGTADQFVQRLKQQGVLMLPVSRQRVRAVTHLDVNEQQIRRASSIIQQVADQFAAEVGQTLLS